MAERKTALVTGASYGVGAAVALALAKEGYAIAITATRRGNLMNTIAAIEGAGCRALPISLELGSLESIERALGEIQENLGTVEVLVNNAAVNLRRAATDVTPAEWAQVMGVNLTGTFFLTQAVGHALIESGKSGSIVNVASVHGVVGAAERSTYGISKAGIIHMTRMLAIEWATHGIRVNAVAPGRLSTESPSRAGTGSDPAYMAAMLKRIPLGRLATVEEVATAIAYLAGSASQSVTGQTIIIDGGLTAA